MIIGIDATNIREGGGVLHLLNILKNVDYELFNIKKILIYASKNLLDKIDDSDIISKVHRPIFEKNYLLRMLWQIYFLENNLKEECCDILFVPGGSFITKFRPIVTMSQNLIPFDNKEIDRYQSIQYRFRFWLLRHSQSQSFKNADGTIFLTNYAKKVVIEITGSLSGQSVVIPHGINQEFYRVPTIQKEIFEYSLDNPLKILYVSNIEPYKNHFVIIEAISELYELGYPIELRMIGSASPKMYSRLQKKIKGMDPCRKFLKFLGPIMHENISSENFSSDLFLFGSSCETISITVMEGMASGLPIVCSNKGPMSELLGDSCLYFDPHNVDSVIRAIRMMLDNPNLRLSKSKSSYGKSLNYSWSRCAKDTFGFISNVKNEL